MPRPTPSNRPNGTPADKVLHFLQTVWQMEHALERASKRMEDALGISGPQRFALRMIGERPGLTPRDLASVLHLHPSTITGIVQRLEGRGLVRREANVSDGRVAHLHLTRAGVRANTPSIRGTVEHAARATLKGCTPRQRKAAAEVIEHFTRELMKI
jgi:DNA-binding MarR family transcriptional regulator